MDDTAELYENELSVFGGPYSQWRAWLDAEQDAARQAERRPRRPCGARSASASRPRRRSRTAQAMGRKAQFEKRVPPIVAGDLKRAAAGLGGQAAHREGATGRRPRARRSMPPSDACATTTRCASTCPIPACRPGAASRRSATASGRGSIQGPERVALVGPNGVGKTTLLERWSGRRVPCSGPEQSASGQRRGPARSRARADGGPILQIGTRRAAHRPGRVPAAAGRRPG